MLNTKDRGLVVEHQALMEGLLGGAPANSRSVHVTPSPEGQPQTVDRGVEKEESRKRKRNMAGSLQSNLIHASLIYCVQANLRVRLADLSKVSQFTDGPYSDREPPALKGISGGPASEADPTRKLTHFLTLFSKSPALLSHWWCQVL